MDKVYSGEKYKQLVERVREMPSDELLREISDHENREGSCFTEMVYAEALERGGKTASSARQRYEDLDGIQESTSSEQLRALRNMAGERTSKSGW